MRRLSSLIHSLASPLLLLGMVLFFCWDLLAPANSEGWWGVDINRLFYPFGHFTAAALKDSHLPLWNPYLFLGFPFAAEPQGTIFYPVTRLFSHWPVEKVVGWSLTLHLGLAALGAYALVRSLGGRKPGALLSGTVLVFSGFTTSRLYAGHYVHLMTWAWLPWTLAAFHWACRRRSLPAAVLAGIPVGMGALAGFPPFWSFGLLAVGLMALYLSAQEVGWQRRAFVLLQLGLMLTAGVLLAGAQLLPTLQLVARSSRVAQQSYEFAAQVSMPVGHLLTLLVPDLFGAPAGGTDFWAAEIYFYWEFCLYLGITPLLLIFLFSSLRDWRCRFFLAVGGGGLLLSFGQAGALHPLLYRFLPGFGLFRSPARAGIFFVLAGAVLSGLALDRWLALPSEERTRRMAAAQRSMLVVGGAALMIAFGATLLGAVQTSGESVQRALLITSQAIRFLLLLLASYALLRLPWRCTRGIALILALVLADLWGFGAKFLVVKTIQLPHLGWIMADLALPLERHTFRVFPTYHARYNEAVHYGFLSTDGYDYFIPNDADVLRELAHQRNDRILDLLSVRYLMVADEDVPNTPTTGWNIVTQPAGAHFYERDHVGPRAFVVHRFELATDHNDALDRLLTLTLDPYATAVLESPVDCAWELPPSDTLPETATILGYEHERVTLEVEAAANGMLILGDLYYPGWRAEVDGQPVLVHRADYALRGVCVSSGQHQVVFTFDPPIVRQGITVSQIGLGAILLTALWAVWEALHAQRGSVRELES